MCVLTCLLGMSAVVMMDTHWMEMECLAVVSSSVCVCAVTLVHCTVSVQHACVRMGSGELLQLGRTVNMCIVTLGLGIMHSYYS